jgi:hypothetical protein
MIIHVWREILKRNLSPRDICRVAQTCTLLRRLCAEPSVWEPFGPRFAKTKAALANVFFEWNDNNIMRACQYWMFPFAKNVSSFFAPTKFFLCAIYFKRETFEYRIDKVRFLTIKRDKEIMTTAFPCDFAFDPIIFLRKALENRCTPEWMWENNPIVKQAKVNGVLL